MIRVIFYPPAAKAAGIKDTEKTYTMELPYRKGMTVLGLYDLLFENCPACEKDILKYRDYLEQEVLTVADHISLTEKQKTDLLRDGITVEFMPVYQGG